MEVNMKKVVALFLIIIGALLVACGDETRDEPQEYENSVSTGYRVPLQVPAIQPTPEPAREAATSISLLLDDWIGWKPIIDANGGLSTCDDSIFGLLNIDVQISYKNESFSCVQTVADYLISGQHNAVGLSVQQFASVYQLLSQEGIEARMYYVVGRTGSEDEALNMGIVAVGSLLYSPRIMSSFVLGSLRALFSHTYLAGEAHAAWLPDFTYLRQLTHFAHISESDLNNALMADVTFFDRRHNLLILHDRNTAENTFVQYWRNLQPQPPTTPSAAQVICVTALNAIQLPASHSFGWPAFEHEEYLHYIFFQANTYAFAESWEKETIQELQNLGARMRREEEINLRVYGFVSLPPGRTNPTSMGWSLAQNRADAIRDFLIREEGICPTRITAVNGGGITSPDEASRSYFRIVRIVYVR